MLPALLVFALWSPPRPAVLKPRMCAGAAPAAPPVMLTPEQVTILLARVQALESRVEALEQGSLSARIPRRIVSHFANTAARLRGAAPLPGLRSRLVDAATIAASSSLVGRRVEQEADASADDADADADADMIRALAEAEALLQSLSTSALDSLTRGDFERLTWSAEQMAKVSAKVVTDRVASDIEQMAKVSAKEITDRVASDIDKVWHPAPAPVRRALP